MRPEAIFVGGFGMGKSDNASEFLDLYRKLEGCIREHYDVPENTVLWLGLAEIPVEPSGV